MNFLPDLNARWLVGHLWSLSVEEHFYFLWPLPIVVFGRMRARYLLAAIIATTPFVRLAIQTYFRGRVDIAFVTPARSDTIAIGCLAAYLVHEPRNHARLRWLGGRASVVFLGSAVVLVLSAVVLSYSGKYQITCKRTVDAAAIATGMLAAVSGPRSAIGRLLEWKPVATVGVLSYSLYLWQQPFLNPHSGLWLSRRPQNLAMAVAAAAASHLLVERPFLRLKDAIGRRGARRGVSSGATSAGR